jgi:hypothetical protein
MEFSKEEGRFIYEGCPILCYGFSTLKGNIQRKEVNIDIILDHKENYININLENQLLIQEPNIIEKEDIFHKTQYEIKDLLVTIDDYEDISQFKVATMYKKEVDIILGLPWFGKLGNLILNT